jgi:hypothetical protein
METIFRCSEYGFLEIGQMCEQDKTIIELAALCVAGVYGAVFVVEDGILHIIFNPEKANSDEIGKAVKLAASMAHCNPSEENIQSERK